MQHTITNISLYKIVQAFQACATMHNNLNFFAFGEAFDINQQTVDHYPMLWTIEQPSTIKSNSIVYTFRVIVADLVDPAIQIEADVRSDTLQILGDIVFLLRDKFQLEVTSGSNSSDFSFRATPFTEAYNDRVSGHVIDISIEVPRTYGACDVPTKACN